MVRNLCDNSAVSPDWVAVLSTLAVSLLTLAGIIFGSFRWLRAEIDKHAKQQREGLQDLAKQQREDARQHREGLQDLTRQQREDFRQLRADLDRLAKQQNDDFRTLSPLGGGELGTNRTRRRTLAVAAAHGDARAFGWQCRVRACGGSRSAGAADGATGRVRRSRACGRLAGPAEPSAATVVIHRFQAAWAAGGVAGRIGPRIPRADGRPDWRSCSSASLPAPRLIRTVTLRPQFLLKIH